MKPQFGLTAADYARHRAGFPESFFVRLESEGIGRPGQAILDVGTGTGTLARGFARRGASVLGLDPDAAMLEAARSLSSKEGVSVEYRIGNAEQTDLPDSTFDIVTAGQCWHWFDGARAAREIERLLRPGGQLVIAHFDWIPVPGNVAHATEELIQRFNPRWKFGGGAGIHPQWFRDLAAASYRKLRSFSFDVDVPYTPIAWRGRIRASAGVGATLSAQEVTAFDCELQDLLSTRFGGGTLQVLHRVFAVLGRTHASD